MKPNTRVLSIVSKEVHHKAMRLAYGTKQLHPGPDCSYCRHSACEKRGTVFAFVCVLKRMVSASACPDFKDSRDDRAGMYVNLANP